MTKVHIIEQAIKAAEAFASIPEDVRQRLGIATIVSEVNSRLAEVYNRKTSVPGFQADVFTGTWSVVTNDDITEIAHQYIDSVEVSYDNAPKLLEEFVMRWSVIFIELKNQNDLNAYETALFGASSESSVVIPTDSNSRTLSAPVRPGVVFVPFLANEDVDFESDTVVASNARRRNMPLLAIDMELSPHVEGESYPQIDAMVQYIVRAVAGSV